MIKFQFKLRVLVFISFLLISGNILAQSDTLSFMHITDLHVIFNHKGYYPDMLENRKQKQYDQGETRLRQFLKTMPSKTNSSFVVATGDLVDFFQAKAMDGSMLNVQIKKFSQLIDDYRVPVFLTLGNHDAFSFEWQNNLLKHTQNYSGQARASWIRNSSCFKNGTYYSQVFHVGETTYKLIFLDDSFYQFLPEDKSEVPYIDKPQLYWLNAQLNESANDVEIIFMHIPLNDPGAQQGHSNDLYSVLAKNPSTRLILAGHYHKNAITEFLTEQGNPMIQVQTGALVQNPENWRQIRLTEKNILVSLPGKTENEMIIPVK